MRLIRSISLLAGLVFVGGSQAAADPITTLNLVVNGDAELGSLAGWTADPREIRVADGPTGLAQTAGSWFLGDFTTGIVPVSGGQGVAMRQVIDVSALPGRVMSFTLSASGGIRGERLEGSSGPFSTLLMVRPMFTDGPVSGNHNSYSTGSLVLTNQGAMSITADVPWRTNFIEFEIVGMVSPLESAGAFHTVFAVDDIFLSLTYDPDLPTNPLPRSPEPVQTPEPTTLALLMSGGLALAIRQLVSRTN